MKKTFTIGLLMSLSVTFLIAPSPAFAGCEVTQSNGRWGIDIVGGSPTPAQMAACERTLDQRLGTQTQSQSTQTNTNSFNASDLDILPTGAAADGTIGARSTGATFGPEQDPGALSGAPTNPLATAAEELHCDQAPSGGALAERLTGALQRIGDQALNTALRRVGGNTTLGGLLNGAIGGTSGYEGQALRMAGGVLQEWAGDNADEIVNALGLSSGGAFGGGLAQFLEGDSIGSIAGNAVRNLFGGGTLEVKAVTAELLPALNIAELGSLSEIPGISNIPVISSIAGDVPVKDSGATAATKSVQTAVKEGNTLQTRNNEVVTQTQRDVNELVRKECVYDGVAKAINNRALAARAAGVLRDADENGRFIENQAADEHEAALAGGREYLRTSNAPTPAKVYLQQTITANMNPVSPQGTDCGKGWDKLLKQGINPDLCANSLAQYYSDLNARMAKEVETYRQMTDRGTRPVGYCTNKEMPRDTPIASCPPSLWSTQLPPDVPLENFIDAGQIANQMDLEDEIGEGTSAGGEVGQLLGDLGTRLLMRGLDFLGDVLVNEIDEVGYSFIDRLEGRGRTDNSREQVYIATNLTNQLDVETQYHATTGQILNNLEDTHAAYSAVSTCYQGLASSTPTLITVDEARTRARAASDAAALFAPQIADRRAALEDSEEGLAQLVIITNELREDQSAEALNAINGGYQALGDARLVHTAEQLSILTGDLQQSTESLVFFQALANAQLRECQAGGAILTAAPAPTT